MGKLLESFDADWPRRGRRPSDEGARLRDRIFWTAWTLAEGSERDLRQRYVVRTESLDEPLLMRQDEFEAYRQGRRSLSSRRLVHLLFRHPSLVELLSWPIELLSLRQAKARTIDAWLSRFQEGTNLLGDPRYVFPCNGTSDQQNMNPVLGHDLERLYERGDAYGFLAILCAYRRYHLQRSIDQQWYAGRYLIRALAGICRDPRVMPYADALIAMTRRLLCLLPDSSIPIVVDVELINFQIQDPLYEPCREIRLKSGAEGRPLPDPEDPIIPLRYEACRAEEAPLPIAGFDHRVRRVVKD